MDYCIIRSCDGIDIWLPATTVNHRRQWLRTWFARDLVALKGASVCK